MSAGDLGACGVGSVVADAGFFVGFDLGDAAVVDGDLDGAEADGADKWELGGRSVVGLAGG